MKSCKLYFLTATAIIKIITIGTLSLAGSTVKKGVKPKEFIIIKVKILTDSTLEKKYPDTLSVFVGSPMSSALGPDGDDKDAREYKTVRNKKNLYAFRIPVERTWGSFRVFSIYKRITNINNIGDNYRFLTTNLYFEPGDNISIVMHMRDGTTSYPAFYGNGSLKNIILKDAQTILEADAGKSLNLNNAQEIIDGRINNALSVLDKSRERLSAVSYFVLKSEIVHSNDCTPFQQFIGKINQELKENNSPDSLSALKKIYASVVSYQDAKIGQKYLLLSRSYISQTAGGGLYYFGRIKYDLLLNNRPASFDSIYKEVKERFKGELRDHMIAYMFGPNRIYGDDLETYIDALTTVKSEDCLKILREFKKIAGQKIPDFKFYDEQGKTISMSDLQGKAVLLDVWFVGCHACRYYYSQVLSKAEKTLEGDTTVKFLSVYMGDKPHWEAGIISDEYTSKSALNVGTGNFSVATFPFFKYYNIDAAPTIILLTKDQKILKFDAESLRSYDSLMEDIKEAQK
jgi:cytochrome oxidase Cu insertion factor (SCO1/SenC/PrrC family)